MITTKAVVEGLRLSKSQCYKNMFRATVASFSTASKSQIRADNLLQRGEGGALKGSLESAVPLRPANLDTV